MTDSTASHPSAITDLLVIGAGPTGLACAIEAQRRGFSAVLVDKGCLCNSLFHYPAHMTFFTTPELLEIGDIPFSSPNQKPSRNEALEYYRKVAEHYRLDVRQYETVDSVTGGDGNFTVHTTDRFGRTSQHRRTQAGHRNRLLRSSQLHGYPGRRPTQGKALLRRAPSLLRPGRAGHRRQKLRGHRRTRTLAARRARHPRAPRQRRCIATSNTGSCPTSTTASKTAKSPHTSAAPSHKSPRTTVTLATPQGPLTLPNHFVFALTGYHPDFEFIERLGVKLDAANDRRPVCDPATLESNVPGIYLAGVIVAGERTNEIFIENGRFHGKQIAESLMKSLGKSSETNALILDEVRHIEANLRNQE